MIESNYNKRQQKQEKNGSFLPAFCNVRAILMVALASELLALVFSLVDYQSDAFWLQLARYSVALQWIALLSTGLLCMFRSRLGRLTDLQSGSISYFLILTVTLLVNIGAIWAEAWLQGQSAFHISQHPELVGNFLVAAILVAIILRFFYLQAQYRQRIVTAADAKLQALQARIHPHFLFNSMNVIAGLIPINPTLAEQLIEDLSDLFRASFAEHRNQVSLQSEIDLCKRYLGIEQLRLGDRLQCQWQLPEFMGSVTIPPLTLQPLLENAIYHGIQPLVEGGLVNIKVTIAGDSCYIVIENPVDINGSDHTEGNNIAVNNIRERLQMLYQDKASLDMHIEQTKCVVALILPCEGAEHENTAS